MSEEKDQRLRTLRLAGWVFRLQIHPSRHYCQVRVRHDKYGSAGYDMLRLDTLEDVAAALVRVAQDAEDMTEGQE